ncbi:hypothetical protein FB45DRAFT_1067774 [Roridomyces roridus]|uniref:BRCT domain-containing protein n=1 Tax=Roridomyces roridus TaxID=1738132 RepID=A0AAD7FAT3_9AGAR|nr:hypothetical protein FB45DRAFT_1067774 [Roridomyces roridus]
MEPIFRGVVYLLDVGDKAEPTGYHTLRRLLDEHGAKETQSFSFKAPATHIITTSDRYMRETCQGNGVIVTTEWVYSSVKTGAQRPTQYYSADPALFLSSFVLSTREIASSCMPRERNQVIEYGGEWLDAPADHTTHIISNKTDSVPGPVIVSIKSLRASLASKGRLPHPSDCVVDGQNVSAAHFYCHGLLAQNPAPIVVTPTPPNRRLCLPDFPCEIVMDIFLAYQTEALATRPVPHLDLSEMAGRLGIKVPYRPRPPRFHYMRAILLLTHVCGRWRSIAHYTADLWTDIQYHFHCEDTRQRRLNLVALWMERSSSREVSLKIQSCIPGARNPVVDFITANAARIRSLHLKLPEPHFQHLLQTPPGSFTALGFLKLEVMHKSATVFKSSSGLSRDLYFAERNFADGGPDEPRVLWDSVTTPFTAFQRAPRLRSFVLDAWAVFNKRCMFDIVPWSNLTEVDFQFVTLGAQDIGDLLPRLTRARKVELQMDGRQGKFMPAVPRKITLPIVSLKWDSSNQVDYSSVFTHLVLPNLKSLDMWNSTGCQGLYDLWVQSGCKLETLSVHESYVGYPGFSQCLAVVPSLTSLTLYHGDLITDELLESLAYNSSTQFILPNLKILKLEWVQDQPMYSEQVMMKMVESRWKKTPLRKVLITPSWKLGTTAADVAEHDRIIQRAKRLVKAGLKFNYGK